MSVSGIIASNDKIYDSLLPNPYPYPAQPNGLGAVLQTDNRAGDQDIVGLNNLQVSKVDNPLLGGNLTIGGAGQDLRIQGATNKGSLLVGNGTSSIGLPVGTNGLVLKANSAQPLGVEWGTDAQGGTVEAVNAGTNISVSGTIAQPIVSLATPTTSNISLGVGTFIEAKDNYGTPNFAMTLDATGFNDIYSSGGVINQEDIAVSSTNVIQTLSATQASDYVNSAVLTCDTNFVSDTRTSQILTTGNEKTATASITCNTSGSLPLSGITCSVSAPTTSPFPDIVAVIGMSCSDTTNPNISLSQSAPFATSYITTIDKNGINQNNSAGTGFNLQTAQDLTLTCPSANKIIVPNGNDIDLSSTGGGGQIFTTEYRKDGYTAQDFNAGNYSGQVQALTSGGSSQMFLSSSNLASASNQYLRLESTFGGDMNIEHNATAGRNLAITTNQNLTIGADNIDLSTTGRLVVPSLGSADFLDYNPALGLLRMTTDNAGGALNPIMFLQNTNATGSVALEIYKNKPTAGIAGDPLFTQSVFGKDAGNAKQEYTRITHTIRDNTAGSEEGSIEMGCFIGGTYQNMLQLNGVDVPNGEVNVLRPIDLSTGSTGLIKTSGTSSVNLTLDASTSAGAGGIVLATKNDTGSLQFTGNKITTATGSGANTGHHLVLTLPDPTTGVPRVYKIDLKDP